MANEKFNGLSFFDDRSAKSNLWRMLIEKFGEIKGIPVKFEVSAAKLYEEGLGDALAREEPPVIMKIHHGMIQKLPVLHGLFEPLDDTKAAQNLVNESFGTYSSEGKIIGLAFNSDAMGILYNKKLIEKYFSLENRDKAVNSVDEVNSLSKLEAFVKDIYEHREEIGVKGVFPTCSFAKGENVQWRSFVMTVPMYYELKEKNTHVAKTFDFKYRDEAKRTYDMFFKYCIGEPKDFGNSNLPGAVETFMKGNAPMFFYVDSARTMYINKHGINTPEQLAEILSVDDMGIITMYSGHEGEEKQNTAIGIAWALAVNSGASEEQKRYAKEFLDWVFFSDEAKDVIRKMEYVLPYKGIRREDIPQTHFCQFIYDRLHDDTKEPVSFEHSHMPTGKFSDEGTFGQFRGDFANNVYAYAKGEIPWDEVCRRLTENWNDGYKSDEAYMKKLFGAALSKSASK